MALVNNGNGLEQKASGAMFPVERIKHIFCLSGQKQVKCPR
jgi:hypothetical protein